MDTTVSIPLNLREAIEEFESERNVQVRYRPFRLGREDDLPQGTVTVLSHGHPSYGLRHNVTLFGRSFYDAVLPPSEGVPAAPIYITDPEAYTGSAVCVGEVQPRLVYDYLGLLQYGATDELEQPFVNALIAALEVALKPELEAEALRAQEAEARRQLAEYAERGFEAQIGNQRAQIQSSENRIRSLEESKTQYMRQAREQQEILDALLHLRKEDRAAKVMREWDKLKDNQRLRNLAFRSSSISVLVDDIVLTHPYGDHDDRWLGTFRISLGLADGSIRLDNLDTRRHGLDHPHVDDGHACFGGHHDAFTKLMMEGELSTLVELLIQYLETYNPDDDYGRRAAYWVDEPDARPVPTPITEDSSVS